MANVKFISVKLKATYEALLTKDSTTLYWIEETNELYKGAVLFGVGREASESYAGLMSATDKVTLSELKSGALLNLTPVDGTITIADGEAGKTIGVAISAQAGNSLIAVDDGLFVAGIDDVVIPEYAIEKQEVAEDGYASSYKLKKTVGEEVTYVGDVINIGKDMVLQSATLETVTEADVPYAGAVVGDPYIDMAFNDANASHIYVPVKGLVDTYVAGECIEIVDGVVSVKIATDSHGLVAVDGALLINLATAESDGAMSKEDKALFDAIPTTYATIAQFNDLQNAVAIAEASYTWSEM